MKSQHTSSFFLSALGLRRRVRKRILVLLFVCSALTLTGWQPTQRLGWKKNCRPRKNLNVFGDALMIRCRWSSAANIHALISHSSPSSRARLLKFPRKRLRIPKTRAARENAEFPKFHLVRKKLTMKRRKKKAKANCLLSPPPFWFLGWLVFFIPVSRFRFKQTEKQCFDGFFGENLFAFIVPALTMTFMTFPGLNRRSSDFFVQHKSLTHLRRFECIVRFFPSKKNGEEEAHRSALMQLPS